MVYTKWFMGNDDKTDAFYVRRKVFVEEQGISEDVEMVPAEDEEALHLVVYENGEPVGVGRLVEKNGKIYIGRVAVLQNKRGMGYGDLIVRMLVRKAYEGSWDQQYIHSQLSVQGFYEKLGFRVYGEVFNEAGLPHISMVHQGDATGKCHYSNL